MSTLASWVLALGTGTPMPSLLYPQVFRVAGLPTSYPTCVCVWGALGCNTSVFVPLSHFLSLTCLGWPTDLSAPPKEVLLKLFCQGLPLQCFGAEMEGVHFENPRVITTETQGMPLFSLMGSPRCRGLVAFPKGSRAHVSGLPHSISSHPPCCVCVFMCARTHVRTCMHACVCPCA